MLSLLVTLVWTCILTFDKRTDIWKINISELVQSSDNYCMTVGMLCLPDQC